MMMTKRALLNFAARWIRTVGLYMPLPACALGAVVLLGPKLGVPPTLALVNLFVLLCVVMCMPISLFIPDVPGETWIEKRVREHRYIAACKWLAERGLAPEQYLATIPRWETYEDLRRLIRLKDELGLPPSEATGR